MTHPIDRLSAALGEMEAALAAFPISLPDGQTNAAALLDSHLRQIRVFVNIPRPLADTATHVQRAERDHLLTRTRIEFDRQETSAALPVAQPHP